MQSFQKNNKQGLIVRTVSKTNNIQYLLVVNNILFRSIIPNQKAFRQNKKYY